DPARRTPGPGVAAHGARDRRRADVGGAGPAAAAAPVRADLPLGGGGLWPVHDRLRPVALVLAVAVVAGRRRRRRHAERLRAQYADPDPGADGDAGPRV